MKIKRWLAVLGTILATGVSISANAGLFGIGGTSWKEEVLLHDGSKIIVERSVESGGRHELFKGLPISEQRLSWRMPGTNQAVTWEDHFSKDVGSATLLPMLVDVHQGSAYVVANPMGCLAYNKWGRPNPPYVVFRYQGKEWQRIPLQELPAEIKTPNLIQSQPDVEAKRIGKNPIPAEVIQKIVASFSQAEFRSILRQPLKTVEGSCGEMVYDGNGGWIGVGFFRKQPSKLACLKYCKSQDINDQYCPCETLFGGK